MSYQVLVKWARFNAQVDELAEVLLLVWSRESSGFPFEWSEKKPSCGQCYPTARLFQALFGGDVIYQRLQFDDGVYVHFVNEIDGVRYDLSANQMAGEAFTIIEEQIRTDEDHRMVELLPHIRRMVDTLFRDYSQHTDIPVAPR